MSKRPISLGMEDILEKPFNVLDKGFVRVVDYIGTDKCVVDAARVSYGEGTEQKRNTRGLIRYLMNHWHSTPFEMCEIKLHVKLPVFVARQWVRHRTANINEYSARYSILDNEFYIPDTSQLAQQSTVNKQGREETLSHDQAVEIQDWLKRENERAYEGYLDVLKPRDKGGEYGLARELARMNLPPSIYTQWYWKVDLHNLMHFLRLRCDPHAQWEIRQYANVMLDEIVKAWVPLCYEAFIDYRVEATQFSAQEMEVLLGAASQGESDYDFGPLSEREVIEFKKKLRFL